MSSLHSAATRQDHVDVIIVGAGLSGIDVAYHLKTSVPSKTFVLLEGRAAIGGTWDLFRYPGIRSDADMFAYGFGFKPWTRRNAIADGHEILDYLQETIDENGLGSHLRLGHQVMSADFSTDGQFWTVEIKRLSDGAIIEMTADMLFSAAGYYDADRGFAPRFVDQEQFCGKIVHPQHWPAGLDYSDQRVVVIGSGATAVTVVPAMATSAAHVTMLQRSPSYVLPIPREDPVANLLRRMLPAQRAHSIARRLSKAKGALIFKFSRRFPRQMRALVRKLNVAALPEGFDVDTHFSPEYAPWDQRMCLVPDGDFFKAISTGKASVVTDQIVRFTDNGILLDSGVELKADMIVTATGLSMVPFGKISLSVDGAAVDLHDKLVYKAVMISDVPNFAFTVGYVNNVWTLKADLVAEWFCRLLGYMDRRGLGSVTPIPARGDQPRRPFIEMNAGYIARAMRLFPQQGHDGPWTADQDLKLDTARLAPERLEDPELHFARARVHPSVATA